MLTQKQIEKINTISSLRRISKNEGISIPFSLYNFLVTGKYKTTIDFDVYLSTKGFNLQRPYVWTVQQQEEFIWSCLFGRSIPPVVFIQHEYSTYLVNDGKQRLLTLKRFMQNEFPIHYEDTEIYWTDLDNDAQYQISARVNLLCTVYYSYDDDPITDDEKITIFNFYNFTGTPQEEAHRKRLINSLSLSK